jgi:LysR family transcriptional regulator for bpeEF and oprC
MDQLSAIRVFVRVVELGGFTKAADSLGMPKATTSKLISELESHLRIKLLKRTTRSVQVTTEGTAYYERTTRWLRELDDMDSGFDIDRVRPHGIVQVDISAWMASCVVIPKLPDFHGRYPDIQVEMNVSDRTGHLMRENADCAIRGGLLTDLSMVGRPLGHSNWMTAATPSYLDRYGTPSHPAELNNRHFLVNYQSGSTGRANPFNFEKNQEKIQVNGDSIVTVNDSNAHLAAGLAGMGILYSFEWKLRPFLQTGQLLPILQEWQPAPYPFHLVYPPNRHLTHRVRVFIDWIIEVFAEH